MVKCSKGPWEIRHGDIYAPPSAINPDGMIAAVRYLGGSKEAQEEYEANQNAMRTAPELLKEAESTDQGWDWFREQMNNLRLYHGAWDMDESEAWANSLIAHINSRQIGTQEVIRKAKDGSE